MPLAKLQNDTITFYCGDESEVSSGQIEKLDSSKLAIPFDDNWVEYTVKCVVFDSSFKQVKPTSTSNLFSYMRLLKTIQGLDNLNTEDVTDMSRMFFGCRDLESIDVSNLHTSKATNMSSMFYGCKKLKSLDVSSFDMRNVTSTKAMFSQCTSLKNINMSGWDTQDITDMSSMFSYCDSLGSIDLSGFDTQNVTDMSAMFNSCKSLTTLDLSGFSTKQVTAANNICSDCRGLVELKLGKNDFSHINDAYYTAFKFTDIGSESTPCTLIVDCSGNDGFDISVLGEAKQDVGGKPYYKWSNGYFSLETTMPTGIKKVNAGHKTFDANAPAFNLQGQRVSSDYRGVVIQDGRKFIR